MTSFIALASILAGGAQQNSKGFATWQQSLASKQSIQATVRLQEIGGSATEYSISLKKPNILKLEDATSTIIADGKNITVFEKKENIWYKRPQTTEEFNLLLSDDKYSLFNGFFGQAQKPAKTADLGSRSLGGENVLEVSAQMDKAATKTYTFYVGNDGIAKRSSLKLAKAKKEIVAIASNVFVDSKLSDDYFAFRAPNGANEIDYNDLISSRWFYDLEEAKLIAKRTNKLVFIDFMASWCGPCKMMDKEVFVTDGFKALGKKLVFCKVDIDFNPAIASSFGVEAIPNMFVIRPDGSVVGSILGYRPAAEFLPELEGLANKG